MAVPALRHLVRVKLDELPAVNVLVAILALFGSLFEVDVDELGFQVRRLMAVDAGDSPVCADQGEGSRVVIEPVQLSPCLGPVTSLASHRLSILADLFRALFELTVMHVLVAAGARQAIEAVGDF